MTHIIDIECSKYSHYRKAAVQRVIDTLHRHNGELFAASEKELNEIRDSIPHGTNVWDIINQGFTRYIRIYGKKSIQNSKEA